VRRRPGGDPQRCVRRLWHVLTFPCPGMRVSSCSRIRIAKAGRAIRHAQAHRPAHAAEQGGAGVGVSGPSRDRLIEGRPDHYVDALADAFAQVAEEGGIWDWVFMA
jgi:hypothetical protein